MVNTKIIRVPEKKYIQVLIAGKNNAALVVDELQMRKISIPTNEMQAIYTEMVTSNPTLFKTNTKDEPDAEWLKDTQLSPMYYYRFSKPTDISLQGCEGAFKMLEDPKMVRYIHALCLAGINADDIELILNAKYNISYETPDFAMFIRYFANYDGWSYTDKNMFVNATQDQDLKKIYRMALDGDRSTLIWKLGLGADPSASFDEMLRDMFTDSYFYFKEYIKFKPDDAQKFAALSIKLADRMDQMADKEREQTDLFSELKMKLNNESTQKSKNAKTDKPEVIDMKDMDVEIPERTETRIQNLEALMNSDGVQNALE
jgi:hypothetical protein